MTDRILIFRSIVFALALGYWIYQFFQTDWTAFGLHFRFLTIWSLTANLIVAAHLLRRSLGWSTARWDAFTTLAVVMSMSVVFNYWRLYLDDPANFYADGDFIDWYQEYYLHVLGPILLWIDAFFIHRAVRRLSMVFLAVLILGVAYPVWIEWLVQPLNTLPDGSVTQGLPYDFLNNMEVDERMIFYGTITGVNIVFVFLAMGIQKLVNKRF
ncbi:MAG: hypothetical protein AAF429_11275 [Pseudomonadota bacterium]